MDRRLMDYLDRRSGGDRRDNRRGDRRDYEDNRRDYDEADYEDSRRGRDNRRERDRRDNRRMRDNRDYEDYQDSEDYEDGRDYHRVKLKKTDIKHWKQKMENADGTEGEHFDMQQVMHAADKLNIKFDEFDEKEFCLAVNMMYSDYCKPIKKYVSSDKELMFCAELAKAFFDDPDAPEPSEKLAMYYYCIVDNA